MKTRASDELESMALELQQSIDQVMVVNQQIQNLIAEEMLRSGNGFEFLNRAIDNSNCAFLDAQTTLLDSLQFNARPISPELIYADILETLQEAFSITGAALRHGISTIEEEEGEILHGKKGR